MNLFDGYPARDEPSLWEQSAQHAPPPYPVGKPEEDSLTALPPDFMPWPEERRDSVNQMISYLRTHASCDEEDCPYDNRRRLAKDTAKAVESVVTQAQAICAVLFAHGEHLAAERILEGLTAIVEDTIEPFLQGAGVQT